MTNNHSSPSQRLLRTPRPQLPPRDPFSRLPQQQLPYPGALIAAGLLLACAAVACGALVYLLTR